MHKLYFITHPDVVIDADVPVEQWPLSERGSQRMNKLLEHGWVNTIGTLFSSTEQKAIDGAEILSQHLDLPYSTIHALGENDRTATGYLPAHEFEAVADQFFSSAAVSVCGWETANDAQQRIVSAVNNIIDAHKEQSSIAIVSHGAVGTLLLCHLQGWDIDRQYDQPGAGGGNYFCFDMEARHVQHDWQVIDAEEANHAK